MIPTSKLLSYAQTMPRTADQPTRSNHPPRRPRHGFFRLALVLALIMSACTALIMGVITSRPYSNPELEALFAQGNGWGGIVIGETTYDEALEILRNHPWVDEVMVNANVVTWWWNGQQPPVYDDSGATYSGRMSFEAPANVVYNMAIATNVAMGDMLTALGSPQLYTVMNRERGFSLALDYPVDDLRVIQYRPTRCGSTPNTYWKQPGLVLWGQDPVTLEMVRATDRNFPVWVYSPNCTPPTN